MKDIQRNQVVEVEIESLAYGGAGVGRVDGFVVFVRGAVPGDLARARVRKKAKSHAEADAEEILRPAPGRVDPPCRLFDRCGGCSWQNLPYEDQLEWKRRHVADALRTIAGETEAEILPTIPSPSVWNYRNKMEYSFGLNEEGETILGFHVPGSFSRIFSVDRCLIHPEPFDALLAELPKWAREAGLAPHLQKSHEGFLRHAVMRRSHTTGGVALALITKDGELPDPPGLAARLKAACPDLQGFVWGINSGLSDVAFIQRVRYTWGDPVLKETINGLTFSVSPQSFFQTNTAGAEVLYRLTVEAAELRPRDRVLDAFCGAGTIGLHCARVAGKVAGIELVREAVWDARDNAKANGVTNATFIAAPVGQGIDLARSAVGGDFTRVVIDPPRGGMDKKSLARLLGLRAPVFVYVSCNPTTLARDVKTAREAGYRLESVRPVDMFPHTFHIETVARLRLA